MKTLTIEQIKKDSGFIGARLQRLTRLIKDNNASEFAIKRTHDYHFKGRKHHSNNEEYNKGNWKAIEIVGCDKRGAKTNVYVYAFVR